MFLIEHNGDRKKKKKKKTPYTSGNIQCYVTKADPKGHKGEERCSWSTPAQYYT